MTDGVKADGGDVDGRPDDFDTGGEADVADDTQLERTIGLGGALAIGVGTMIGAGIFVFPGLAADQAGPAAALSFVVGGVVALLVGYHVVPDQTTPEQASDQFGERAEERLEELAVVLEEAGATVESTMVFTHDEKKTIERLREEHEPEAILHHQPSVEFDSVFVPLHPEFETERIAGFVAELLVDEDAKVYVRGYGEDGESRARSFETELEDQRVERAQTVYDAADLEGYVSAVAEDADEHDIVVVQRREEGLKQKLADAAFGTIGERVADASRGPVLEML